MPAGRHTHSLQACFCHVSSLRWFMGAHIRYQTSSFVVDKSDLIADRAVEVLVPRALHYLPIPLCLEQVAWYTVQVLCLLRERRMSM